MSNQPVPKPEFPGLQMPAHTGYEEIGAEVTPTEPEYVEVGAPTMPAHSTPVVSGPPIPQFLPAWSEPEAPVVAYTTLWLPDGGWINFTMRGKDPVDTLTGLMDLMKYANAAHGITAAKPAERTLPQIPGASPVSAPTAPQPRQPQAPEQAAAGPQAPQPRDNSKGTDRLMKLVIIPGGKEFDFYVGKFEFPFKNFLGAAAVATLFDPALGVTPEFLSQPFEWVPDAPLYVDWVLGEPKPRKNGPGTVQYRNVIRVHK